MRVSRLVALVLALAGSDLGAHHAIGRVYDATRQVTLEGTVTEFRFTNPHPLLFIDVVTESGLRQSWRLEMDNRFELARIGMSPETFQPGDRVAIRGSAARTRPQSL